MLAVDDLHVEYRGVRAVRGVTLRVEDGEFIAILGANGAGKTSVMSALMGLVRTVSGEVTLNGEPVTDRSTEQRVVRGLALCPEGRHVFGGLSVAENLRLGAGRCRRAEFRRRLDEVHELFPALAANGKTGGSLLSGGQQQQLAIGRALMSGPRLLLLDEPSQGLDPQTVASVFATIAELHSRGLTIVVVDQNAGRALTYCQRAYVMASGIVVKDGTAATLSVDEIEETYLGGVIPDEAQP